MRFDVPIQTRWRIAYQAMARGWELSIASDERQACFIRRSKLGYHWLVVYFTNGLVMGWRERSNRLYS